MHINLSEFDKFDMFKRKVYLIIFPALFLINSTYWLFSPYLDHFLFVILPFVCLFLLVGTFFFYKKLLFRFWELLSLSFFTFYHLFRVYTLSNDLIDHIINVYAMWSPLFFICVFLVLNRKSALVFSISILVVSIVICIPGFQDNRANDTLIQYYLTVIVYITFLYFFQGLVSNYIESDILRKFAFEDPLTRIGNRRLIDSWIEQQIANSLNHNLTFSIIYFDIDHFKRVNDQHGHDVGDEVLKEFVSVIKKHVEVESYLFGRWGGEEFIIVAPNLALLDAVGFAEMLRYAISTHAFSHVGSITASFGVTDFRLDDEYKTLLLRADHALYLAKEKGRNRVVTS